MEDISLERFIQTEERSKSNTHRLDCLEKLVEAVNLQSKYIAELVVEIRHTNENLTKQDIRITEIEKIPKARWNQVISAVIAAVIGSLIGSAIAKFIK